MKSTSAELKLIPLIPPEPAPPEKSLDLERISRDFNNEIMPDDLKKISIRRIFTNAVFGMAIFLILFVLFNPFQFIYLSKNGIPIPIKRGIIAAGIDNFKNYNHRNKNIPTIITSKDQLRNGMKEFTLIYTGDTNTAGDFVLENNN